MIQPLAFIGLLALNSGAAPAQAPPARQDDAASFAAALERCDPATWEVPHPLVRPFMTLHTVLGENDGTCAYEQTMPGNMKMACAFTPAGRKAMADEIRALADDTRLEGSTKGPQPPWSKECEIVTASGQRLPVGK